MNVSNRICLAFQVASDMASEMMASRVVCKSGERVTGPVLIHSIKDAEKDSFTTAASGEGAHRPDAPPDFNKQSFDDVGGPESFPMSLRRGQEGQEFFQVGFQTGHSVGSLRAPAALPLSEEPNGLGRMNCLIDEFGFLQTVALGGFEFVFQ